MKKFRAGIIVSCIIAATGSASATPPPVVNVPEGTPDEVKGFSSQTLYVSYENSIRREIERASNDALNDVRPGSIGYANTPHLRPHGVSFRYRPLSQSEAGKEGHGRIYYSCRRESLCDWVMEVVTVPIVDYKAWSQKHFDAYIAAANLKAHNVSSNDGAFYLGYLMRLSSPKKYIEDNSKEQLYFGKDCPEFVQVLAAESYGHGRARELLSLSMLGGKLSEKEYVKSAAFEISIVETADDLEDYSKQPIIELKFNGPSGKAVGNALFESIQGCPNRAGAEL